MNTRALALAALLPSVVCADPAPVPRAALASVATDTVSVIAWPLELDQSATLLLAFTAQGLSSLLRDDTRLYRQLHRVEWHVRRSNVFERTVLLGDGLFDLGVVSAFALGDERARRVAIAGMEALASVAATSVLMKHLFRVPRPVKNEAEKKYFAAFRDDAFPSGHTMSAFATAAVISSEYPVAAPFAYAAAALVGLSVMKVGWHWPSDVLAGATLGVLIGRTALKINQRRLTVVPSGSGLSLAAEI